MKQSTIDLLMSMSLINANDYGGYFSNDARVLECVWDMYFYMLYSGINEEKKEEYFNEFDKKYKKLNNEQQEIVRNEYMSIMETQEKNKEKVKKKGMIKYE